MGERLRGGGMLLALIAVSAAACALLPATARASVRVMLPRDGRTPHRLCPRFRNPSRTGIIAGTRRVDQVLVSGPRGSRCVSSVVDSLRPAAVGAGMRTVVRPGGRRRWCAGRFHGLLVADGSGGTDTPSFAGLQSATTCTGAAPVHGSPPGRTYTLSRASATDPVTPSSGIVYDILFASSPGGENFASPTWTTAPGAMAYSGNLATSGSAISSCARATRQATRTPARSRGSPSTTADAPSLRRISGR